MCIVPYQPAELWCLGRGSFPQGQLEGFSICKMTLASCREGDWAVQEELLLQVVALSFHLAYLEVALRCPHEAVTEAHLHTLCGVVVVDKICWSFLSSFKQIIGYLSCIFFLWQIGSHSP